MLLILAAGDLCSVLTCMQISLVNAPEARNVPQKIKAIIAGSAPTAQLIGELEKKGIEPVHVYGLT